jgi:phospholipid/cholesterol/gamma-HCH transport system substrate-binding protein
MRRGQKRRLSDFQAGVILTVAAAIVLYLGFTKAIPFRHHFTVNAVFRTSNNLRPDSPVRIAGVNVGKVVEVRHLHAGEPDVLVKMRIDDKGRPIHKDATFAIRPRIFLEGNFFVDLHPGTPSAPVLGDGDTVQASRTRTPVQFDQILTSLQSDTRGNLKTLLREYATGVADGGATGFNRSMTYWLPAYRSSAIVNQATLGTQPHDLSGYVKGAGAVAGALDDNPARLKSLITDLNATARAFAVQQGNLEATVAELPRTLRAARPALRSLNDAFPPLRRLVVDLRPATRSSLPAIEASVPFVAQARRLVSRPELRGLVADLRPTVPALARLNAASVPLYRQLRAASSCQNEVILPWSRDEIHDPNFPTHLNGGTTQLKVYQEAVRPLPGLAGESRTGDANGQWYRILPGNGTNTYNLTGKSPSEGGVFGNSLFPLQGVNPGKLNRPPLRPNVPCETQVAPSLVSNPAPPPPKVATRGGGERIGGDAAALLIGTLRQQVRRQSMPRPNAEERARLHSSDVKIEALRGRIEAQVRKGSSTADGVPRMRRSRP